MNGRRLFGGLMALCLLSGCGAPSVSNASASSASAEPAEISPVYTNWSKLTPYEAGTVEPLYTQYQPYQGDSLTARDDYGPLLPYVGAIIAVSNYIVDELPLYGLVTSDGRVVTEPVYADIQQVSLGTGKTTPFLLLYKGDPTQKLAGRESNAGQFSLTVVSADGKTLRDFDVAGVTAISEDLLAVTTADDSVTVIDAALETRASFPRAMLTSYLGEDYTFDMEAGGGYDLGWKDGVGYIEYFDDTLQDWRRLYYLNPSDGTVSAVPPEGWTAEWPDVDYPVPPVIPGYSYLDPIVDLATGITYFYGPSPENCGDYTTPLMDVFNEDMEQIYTVHRDAPIYNLFLYDGLCASFDHSAGTYGTFSYFNADGDCVFRYPVRGNAD